MTASIRIPRTLTLARLLAEPGGMRMVEAVAQAAQNLERVRDDCLDSIDRHLGEIERLCEQAGRTPSSELKDEIYRSANEIHGMAGVFGLHELGEAAFSLCELIDRLQASHGWRSDAVAVHLSALRLLRRPERLDHPETVLDGLRRVTDRTARGAD